MVISDLCIKRPVFATVINIFLILIGIVAFQKLTVREYPNIDEPVITVETNYLGASAEIIESQVTKTLEDSLAGIEGIEVMSSISRSEQSQITLRFKLTRDPDAAAAEVRDKVGRVRGILPDEIDEPIISKVEADAQPIIYLAFYSDHHSPMEITDFADRYVKDRIQNITGVANVIIIGERRKSMRIWLDPRSLAAFDLAPSDVENALRRQNVEIPAGRIESTSREFTVLSESDLQTPEQFDDIILKQSGTAFVRLKNVGHAEVYPADERRIVRFNGQDSVALGVVKQATANPLDVSAGIYKMLPEIEKSLPQGMKISVAYDSSVFIDRSINAVYHSIFEAVILVIAVIFIFLRNVRSTLIPLVTIPISIIGTFMIMYMFGYSINTLTLLAMVLAIGLVVDDAIVMLENIYRHIEEGMPPMQAALKGSSEIAFAVLAMTITLIAVYAPITFSEGKTGKLFTEFAMTLAGAVLISGFIALTLTPMMCSRLLRHQENHGRFYTSIENFFNRLNRGYEKTLGLALHHRFIIIIIGLCVAGCSAILLTVLNSELAPIEDRGTIVTIGIAPEGATIDYTAKWMRQLEPIFKSYSDIEKYFVVAGIPTVSQGIAFARLKPWEQRTVKQQEITQQLGPKIFMAMPGILAFPVNPPSLGASARSKPIEVAVMTNGTYEELDASVTKLMQALAANPAIINLDSDLKLNKPQLSLKMDRNKLAAVGVSVDEVGRTLETLLGGRQVTRYKDRGEQYDVIVKISDAERENPQDINEIYVRNEKGDMIKLSNLISFEENVAPRELNHFNQLRAAKITGIVAQGHTLGEALNFIETTAKATLPDNMLIDYDGQSREFKKSSSSLFLTFSLALCFIYLVLAAQFESWVSPFIIMLTVPLSITGALLALYLSGGTLNIYSQVGLVTLIGLITKHGILIVEFSNQMLAKGSSHFEAISKSAALRLRPILMTTGAMVLGAFPLAFSTGAGAESRHQIGWVIIGGMTIGTFFTLFVIPSVYLTFAKFIKPKISLSNEDVPVSTSHAIIRTESSH